MVSEWMNIYIYFRVTVNMLKWFQKSVIKINANGYKSPLYSSTLHSNEFYVLVILLALYKGII